MKQSDALKLKPGDKIIWRHLKFSKEAIYIEPTNTCDHTINLDGRIISVSPNELHPYKHWDMAEVKELNEIGDIFYIKKDSTLQYDMFLNGTTKFKKMIEDHKHIMELVNKFHKKYMN